MRVLSAIIVAAAVSAPAASQAEDAAAARGAYLVNAVAICGRCHTTPGPGHQPFAGGRLIETSAYKVQGSNITPDPQTGIGSWSDEQIGRAITEGRRPDGSRMASAMPYNFYAVLTDADRAAIVAYLRTLAPARNQTAAPVYAGAPAPAAGVPAAEGRGQADSAEQEVEHGHYLATLARCLSCHSAPGADGEPDLAGGRGKGGASFEGPWGVVVAPDITPRALAGWSDADIRRALVDGVAPDGRKLAAPMQAKAYAQLRPDDIAALIVWLRHLPEN